MGLTGSIAATAALSGCLDDIGSRIPGTDSDTDQEPRSRTTPEETETQEEIESGGSVSETEYEFSKLEDKVIGKVEQDQELEEMLSYRIEEGSTDLMKVMLEDKPVDGAEVWGLYASAEMSGWDNMDDFEGFYESGSEGREQLRNDLWSEAEHMFDRIDFFAEERESLITEDRVNMDEVDELGIIFVDKNDITVGYIASGEDLEEIYTHGSREERRNAYREHFMNGFEFYLLEDSDKEIADRI